MEYIQLLGGLLLLLLSANYLVKGGVSLAERLKISPLVIGMTVIAFGTSAPEFIVSLSAALQGNSEIALGNVIGSNIANIGLILGVTALIFPLPVQNESVKNDGPMMLLASVLFILAAMSGVITRLEGFIGFGLMMLYTVWMVRSSRKASKKSETTADATQDLQPQLSPLLAGVYIVGASAGLAYGADLLINSATQIALAFGVSQKIIGVTIVSFGTSLPELAASVTAAFKRQSDISIGNVIGSNLFNILGVIGFSSMIHPIVTDFELFQSDFVWMLAFTLLMFLLIYPLRKNFIAYMLSNACKSKFLNFTGGVLGRASGVVLIVLYVGYIWMLF
jgi:cation:H+ antiporter